MRPAHRVVRSQAKLMAFPRAQAQQGFDAGREEAVRGGGVAPAVDEQFGQAVGVVAALRPGASVNLDDLRQFGRLSLADYKLPRRLVVVDEVVRSPSGKPDYRWARSQLDR